MYVYRGAFYLFINMLLDQALPDPMFREAGVRCALQPEVLYRGRPYFVPEVSLRFNPNFEYCRKQALRIS